MKIKRLVKFNVMGGCIVKDSLMYKKFNEALNTVEIEGDFNDNSLSYNKDEFLTPSKPILVLIGREQFRKCTALVKSIYLQPQLLEVEFKDLPRLISNILHIIEDDNLFPYNKHVLWNVEKVRSLIPERIHRYYDSLVTNLHRVTSWCNNEEYYREFLDMCEDIESECTEEQKDILWVLKESCFKAAIINTEKEYKDIHPEPIDVYDDCYDPREV